jgi:hypothetical protein
LNHRLLGYELKDEAKPLAAGEFKKLLDSYLPSLQNMNQNKVQCLWQQKENISDMNNQLFLFP